jgi:anaerobic ribonucleoside-triphosphate reductase activating protein
VARTEAEGPGLRYALWVQGCPMRCPGCCNPHYLTDTTARRVAVTDLLTEIRQTPGIEGATFLGGEPFAQAEALGALATGLRAAGLSVMVFSGYTRAQLHTNPTFSPLLAQTDLLVDGLYDKTRPDTTRRWIGSANQQIHFLSGRYKDLSGRWPTGETVELRLRRTADGAVSVSMNGYPHDDISALIRASLRRKP